MTSGGLRWLFGKTLNTRNKPYKRGIKAKMANIDMVSPSVSLCLYLLVLTKLFHASIGPNTNCDKLTMNKSTFNLFHLS